MKIFITGVSSGIGKALAELLLREGHEVWGVARRSVDLPKLMFSQCDVSLQEDVDRVTVELKSKNFIPDIVVLNAGVYEVDMQDAYDHKVASRVNDINLYGALIWVEKLLPDFLARKNGQFIAISSVVAYRPDPSSSSYPASKAALSMAFRSFRLRYQDSGVRFKSVHFGPIDTPIIPRSKKRVWIASADQAASYIQKVITSRRSKFFYPWNSWLIRLTSFLPDNFAHTLTKKFRR